MSPGRQDPLHEPFRWEDDTLGIPMEGKLFKDLKKAAEFKEVCEKFVKVDYPSAKGATEQKLVACMKKRITVLVQNRAFLTAAKVHAYDFSNVEPRKVSRVKGDFPRRNSTAYNTARDALPNKHARDEADWEVVEHLFINASYFGLTHEDVVDALITIQGQGTTKKGEAIAIANQKVYLVKKAQEFYEKLMKMVWPSQDDRMDQDGDLGLPMNGQFFKDLKTEDDFNAIAKSLVEVDCKSVGECKESERNLRVIKKRVTVLVQRYACKKYMQNDIIISKLHCGDQFTKLHRNHLHSIVNAWKPLLADDKEAMEQEMVNHLFRHAEHFGLTLVDVVEAFKRLSSAESGSDTEKLVQNLADKAGEICAAIACFQAPDCLESDLDEEPLATESDVPLPMDLHAFREQAEAMYQKLCQSSP